MHSLWQDVTPAVRLLRKTPAFALCSIVVLCLAIGATTTVFSVANSVLLRPLPHLDLDAGRASTNSRLTREAIEPHTR